MTLVRIVVWLVPKGIITRVFSNEKTTEDCIVVGRHDKIPVALQALYVFKISQHEAPKVCPYERLKVIEKYRLMTFDNEQEAMAIQEANVFAQGQAKHMGCRWVDAYGALGAVESSTPAPAQPTIPSCIGTRDMNSVTLTRDDATQALMSLDNALKGYAVLRAMLETKSLNCGAEVAVEHLEEIGRAVFVLKQALKKE